MTASTDEGAPYVLDKEIARGTDEANAQLLAQSGLPQLLRYSVGLGWLAYNPSEGRWAIDSECVDALETAGKHLRAAVKTYTDYLCRTEDNKETYLLAKSWRKMVGNTKSVKNALEAARGKTAFLTKPDAWDAKPYEVNFSNGVLNLLSREFRAHNPNDLMMRQAGAS